MRLIPSHKPFKNISVLWLVAEVPEIQTVRRTLYAIVALKIEGLTREGMWSYGGAHSDIWLTDSKETGNLRPTPISR